MATSLHQTPSRQSSSRLSGWSLAAGVLAFIACNGAAVLVGLFSLAGISLVVNSHVPAAVITVFALAAMAFVYLGFKTHQQAGPVILASIGAALVVGSMYIYFNKWVESIGLVMLLGGALWSWWISRPAKADQDG